MAGKIASRTQGQSAALALDPVIHERVRLAVLTALGSHGELLFTELKDLTRATDGNLSAHLAKLEEAGYVEAQKGLFGRRVKTSYGITPAGRQALASYLDALERLLGEMRGA
jgi:DNA-binding MarR family transcriptional regulator